MTYRPGPKRRWRGTTRRLFRFAGIPLFWFALLAAPVSAEPLEIRPEALQAEDGDTLLVRHEGKELRIQLIGIDAPEDSHNPKLQRDLQRTGLPAARLLAIGETASARLQALLEEKAGWRLLYDPAHKDRYGRLTGSLMDASGHSAARRMVTEGYARPLGGPQQAGAGQTNPLVPLAEQARRQGIGLWALDADAMGAWAGAAP